MAEVINVEFNRSVDGKTTVVTYRKVKYHYVGYCLLGKYTILRRKSYADARDTVNNLLLDDPRFQVK